MQHYQQHRPKRVFDMISYSGGDYFRDAHTLHTYIELCFEFLMRNNELVIMLEPFYKVICTENMRIAYNSSCCNAR